MQARGAHPNDRAAIETLNQKARRSLPTLWWWDEHLAHDLFVVVERDKALLGALFAWPDESPVAWVRLAVVDDAVGVGEWLDLALPLVLHGLRRQAHSLAWMDNGAWVGPYLPAYGFQRLTDVMTLVKLDHALPAVRAVDARLRLASEADIPALIAMDRAAFTAHWWHSRATLCRRITPSSYLVVAERTGQVVGYAEGEVHPPAAHLNRIAVHPAQQGHGIGALLLRDALSTFWRRGAEYVTLNTQADNHSASQLYRRFKFGPTGDWATVWQLQIEGGESHG